MATFKLHCDVCGHDEPVIGKLERKHIGTPCPVCTADMLSEADFKVGRRVEAIFAVLKFFGLAKDATPEEANAAFEVKHGEFRIL